MSNEHKDNLKLQEALNMDTMRRGRKWKCLGIHVEVGDIPKNTTDHKTTVKILSNLRIAVAVEWTVQKFEGPKTYIKVVEVFFSPEELQMQVFFDLKREDTLKVSSLFKKSAKY